MKSIKTIFISLNLIMTALICFSGVDLFYHFVFSDLLPKTGSEVKVTEQVGKNKNNETQSSIEPLEAYSSIYDKNLFGTLVSKVISKPEIDIAGLDKTSLKLKLMGTVVGFQNNYAVILSNNKQELYTELDKIQDAEIKRIFRQKVVLTRNGKDEILVIDPEEGQKSEYFASIDSSISSSGEDKYQISREFVNKSLDNLNSLMRQARARPHFENGNPSGIAIDSIKDFSLFKKMGLENGDIIVGANGNEIKTVSDAIGLYNGLKSSDSISLQIKRKGQGKTIEYNIE
ncbi:MAG: type II secretion system protein GspC [Desulforegulaceae bacterium]|nr:type II secretion system protein GspC [Desulforegulaceae bacterium]